VPFEIIKPGTRIDFLSRWRLCVALSILLILAGMLAIPVRGFRLGIDFAGGTEVQVRFTGDPDVGEGAVRDALSGLDIPNPSVIRYGEPGSGEFLIKFQGERQIEGAEGAEQGAVTARTDRILALEEALQERVGDLALERVEFVGPKVGAELREDGLAALGIACLLILVYIAFRFSARFAPGAVAALVHDVLVTSSVWILLGLEFDLRVLAALLAIVGYSLNDTIIVYDRIRENMELRTRTELAEVLNLSVNQTLSRTLLTSGTTLVAVLSLLFVGGEVIRPFALAMAIGILVGTYSSIYIAAPVLLLMERRAGGGSTTEVKPGRAARTKDERAPRSKGKGRPRGKAARG
jgi:preprotein translocase SecF subunit